MKRVKEHGYWRSLDQLADTEDFRSFLEGEFPAKAPESETSSSRRTFMKLMGASVAMAGLTACRWPTETIVPYASRPEGFDPGKPVQFATSMEIAGVGIGLLATSYDGRPVKVDGNPDHPASRGAASAAVQASVLGLYDPERSTSPAQASGGSLANRSWKSWDEFARQHFAALRGSRGRGLGVLSEASASPTLDRQKALFMETFPEATWVEYEPVSRDNEREGTRRAFGAPMRPVLKLDKAKLVVTLDADLLGEHPDALRHARDFAAARKPESGHMSRLYALESLLSVTGSQADHRYPLAGGAISVAALRLAGMLIERTGASPSPELRRALEATFDHPFRPEFLEGLADDLATHKGHALVAAGARQPAEVHAAVALINRMLGAEGTTLDYVADPGGERPSHAEALAELVANIEAGAYGTLLILGGNPAYAAPGDVDVASALGKVATTIHLSEYRDETSRLCSWHLPRAHYLEAWADTRSWEGQASLTQPLIQPLYGGRTPAELLAQTGGQQLVKAHELVKATWSLGQKAWRKALHDGVVPDSAWPTQSPTLDEAGLAETFSGFDVTWPAASEDSLELVLFPDSGIFDGRFANNHWLQEMPDPMTKMVWDNAALIGPMTAEALGVGQGEMVKLEVGGRSVEAPVYIMPGQAANTVGLALGYGREAGSEFVAGQGFNPLALTTASGSLGSLSGAKLTKLGRTYDLVTTQDHFALDAMGQSGLDQRLDYLVRETTWEKYQHDPKKSSGKKYKLWNLWKSHEYEGHKWAMAIDLNACTGCSACVVACQAENNIPIVGKERVGQGREMHWLRIDRYFKGDVDDPQVVTQPVTCMHCEDAPCEQVCPVAATVHDDEGLNVMVYNRCVGTRYCSNNCPYKVRRFNFFNYREKLTEMESMQLNPEVTVRMRGVMEKCTFCTQRITKAKIEAKVANRTLRDGEIVTACEQTCPTQAITFGDLNDPESRVRKMHENDRSYAMLDYLNVKPRLNYLVRLRNPAGGHAGHHEGGHGSANKEQA